MMRNNEKKAKKKKEIIGTVEHYRDKAGSIDLSKLRNEKPKVYAKIPYYFGSIDKFMIEVNSDIYSNTEEIKSLNTTKVRNQLAFENLKQLRLEDYSFEELGMMYEKSKMYMSKLYRSLETDIKNETSGGTTLNRPVVRNKLAYERLNNLVNKEKLSFEQIASKYETSADFIKGLYKDWSNIFKDNNNGMNVS